MVSLSFSSMQPFSPESIVETKGLNYGEISTEKCMALFRHDDYKVTAQQALIRTHVSNAKLRSI